MDERLNTDIELQARGGPSLRTASGGSRGARAHVHERSPSVSTATTRTSLREAGRPSISNPTSPISQGESPVNAVEGQESADDAEHLPLSPTVPTPQTVPHQNSRPTSGRWKDFRSRHPIFQLPLTWLATIFCTALFILTVLYAFSTTSLFRFHPAVVSANNTIFVLRILSEATAFCMMGMIDGTLERLQWMLVSTERGVAFLDYLALNQGTNKWGLAHLIVSKRRGGHLWSMTRLVLVLLVPALSIIILSETSGEVTFPYRAPFDVAAGVGDFNVSWATLAVDAAALQFESDINRFLSDRSTVFPTSSVVPGTSICPPNDPLTDSDACKASYFIAGSLSIVTPWPSKNLSALEDDIYVLHDVQGLQLDFSFADEATFDGTTDCIVHGNNNAAIQFCVSKSEENIIYAKMVQCPIVLIGQCFQDTSWHSSTGWVTAMTAYKRRTTVHYARYNESILSIGQLSSPEIITHIKGTDFLTVFNETFAGHPSGFSSNTIGNQFIVYLATHLEFAVQTHVGNSAAASNLRNLLALPLYYFTPNYLSPWVFDQPPLPDSILQGLPRELYVTASLTSPSYRVRVAPWTVWVYTFVGALIILLCITVLLFGSLSWTAGGLPNTTLWPNLDFVVNCGDGKTGDEDHLVEILRQARGVGSREAMRRLQNVRLYKRETV